MLSSPSQMVSAIFTLYNSGKKKKGTVNICHVSEDKQLCYTETMTETEKSHTEGVADKSNSRKAALLIPLYHALKQQATLNGLDHGKSIF